MTTTVNHTASSRMVAVLRMHLTNKWTTLGTPLVILTGVLAGNYVVWLIIYTSAAPGTRDDSMQGTQYSGAIFCIFFYMLIVGMQAILRTFPFALGFSVTRRNFALGTALLFVVLSAIYTVIITVASYVEQATGGWGLGGHMFSTVWFGTESLGERLALAFCAFLFVFFVGSAVATVYLRWRATGMIVFAATVVVIGLCFAAAVTAANGWMTIGDGLISTGLFGSVLWSLVITALAALVAFRILSRATPTN